MSYALVKFQAEDLTRLLGGQVPYSTAVALEKQNAWSLFHQDVIVGCAGTMECWRGRYIAWAYLGRGSKVHMGAITKHTLNHLAELRGRIELTVQKDFTPGHRWAKILGFEVETPLLRAYGPNAEDHVGYVKFQE